MNKPRGLGAGTACRPLRAATEGSAFGYRKPLKRLDPNFKKSVGLLPCSFCGDPGGRIVQVISLREITCCSCGEALLSPNVPPKISQGIPSVALFATCVGSIPPDLNKKSTAVAVLFVLVTLAGESFR